MTGLVLWMLTLWWTFSMYPFWFRYNFHTFLFFLICAGITCILTCHNENLMLYDPKAEHYISSMPWSKIALLLICWNVWTRPLKFYINMILFTLNLDPHDLAFGLNLKSLVPIKRKGFILIGKKMGENYYCFTYLKKLIKTILAYIRTEKVGESIRLSLFG